MPLDDGDAHASARKPRRHRRSCLAGANDDSVEVFGCTHASAYPDVSKQL
jgi:hypothetical protein